MIRPLALSELESVATLCLLCFGPAAGNVARILPPAVKSGQAHGYFEEDGKLIGARVAFLEVGQFRTQIVAVNPSHRGDGIATELSFAGRADALRRGINRTVATTDLTNKSAVSLAVNRLGLTASKLEHRNALDASFLWTLDGSRASAAVNGGPIPGDVRSEISISDAMEKAEKIALLSAAFDARLLLIGLRVQRDAGIYLMGNVPENAA